MRPSPVGLSVWICAFALVGLVLAVNVAPADTSDLYEAAKLGNLPTVEQLIARGADVDAVVTDGEVNRGWSPLMIAAANGHVEVVRLLIAKGANVNHTNDSGRSALMFAVWYGYAAVVRDLLAADARVDIEDDLGQSAVGLATATDRPQLRSLLEASRAE